MSTQPIRDYLTKQLLIEKNIVTYRSLSRVLALNVNVAKNELAEFHANDGQGSAATYLLSGETRTRPDEDVDMDDNPYAEEDDEEEYVPQTEIILVTEGELESAQAQFIALDSIHVYSLSPSVIRDAGLLCTPTEIVRSLDTKKGSELAAIVGKVISADVNISNKPLPTWGGRKAPPPVAGPSKIKKEEEMKTKEKEKEKPKPEKPKPTGKLDFSKAKTKPLKKEEEKPVKAEPKSKVAASSTIGDKVQAKMDESKKRGTKRKSALASDSEEEKEKVIAKPAGKPVAQAKSSSVRVRKGVVLSDDEDDDTPPQPTRKGKGKESEAEKDLRAMMDIDDDAATVTRASRAAEPEPDPKSEDEPDEDVPMEAIESDNAKPAPVKRKPKKVVPVGRNGLKKKRVVKSKSHIDDEGFMVMEDYSEYESVDEEEPAPAPKGKKSASSSKSAGDAAPAKTKAAAAAPKPKPAPAPAKSKPKPSGGSAKSGQPTVASFFGKSKSK